MSGAPLEYRKGYPCDGWGAPKEYKLFTVIVNKYVRFEVEMYLSKYAACNYEVGVGWGNIFEYANEMLSKLGFKKVKPSILMIMNLINYNKTQQTDNLISSLKYNKDLLKKINILYNSNIDEVKISIEKVVLKKDEELRCKLQNSIFSSSTRVPLEVEDIENDIEQEYYIEDLSLFIKVNNTVPAPFHTGVTLQPPTPFIVLHFSL